MRDECCLMPPGEKQLNRLSQRWINRGRIVLGKEIVLIHKKAWCPTKTKKKPMIIIIFLLLHYSHPHFLSVLSILLSSLPSSVEHTCWLEHTNARQTGNYYLTTGHGKEKEVSVCLCVRERVRLCHLSYITHVCFNGFPLWATFKHNRGHCSVFLSVKNNWSCTHSYT